MCVAVLLFLLSGWLPNRVWNFISFFLYSILYYFLLCFFLFLNLMAHSNFLADFFAHGEGTKSVFSFLFLFFYFYFLFLILLSSVSIRNHCCCYMTDSFIVVAYDDFSYSHLVLEQTRKSGESLSIFLSLKHPRLFFCSVSMDIFQ